MLPTSLLSLLLLGSPVLCNGAALTAGGAPSATTTVTSVSVVTDTTAPAPTTAAPSSTSSVMGASTLIPIATGLNSAPSASFISLAIPPVPSSSKTAKDQVSSATTSSASSTKTSDTNINGSPFDNMQAGASQWSYHGLWIAAAFAAGAIVRL